MERRPLNTQLLYIVVGVFILLLNAIWILPTRSAILEYTKNQEIAAMENARAAVELFLREKILLLTLTTSHFEQLINSTENGFMARRLLTYQEFNNVSIADIQGSEIFHFDRFTPLFSKNIKTEETSRAFASVIETKKPYYGQVRRSAKLEPVITVGVPVLSFVGTLQGVLMADINLKLMFEELSAITIHGKGGAYVVNKNGDLISHKDISLVLKNTNVLERAIVQETIQKRATIAARGDTYAYVNERGVRMIPVASLIPETEWVVVFEEPASEALSALRRIDIAATATIAGGVILLIFMFALNQSTIRARREAERRAREQAAALQFGQLSLSLKNPDTLMQEAVRIVRETLATPYAKVLELSPDKKTFLLRAGTGWKDGYIGTERVPADTSSQAGFTLLSRAPVTTENLSTETRFRAQKLLLDHGVKSGISIIISGNEKPFGVLGVHDTSPRVWTKSDIAFMESISNTLSVALRRIAAEKETAERSEEILQLNKFMIGRELKMIELKQEMEQLRKKIGR